MITLSKVTVRLKEPYWSAGQRFNWNDGVVHDNCGFGVDVKLLEPDKILRIHSGPKAKWGVYEIPTTDAMELCTKLRAFMYRKTTRLAVIPRQFCNRIK